MFKTKLTGIVGKTGKMPWSGDDWGAAPSWDNKPKADTSFEDEWGISASKNVDAG